MTQVDLQVEKGLIEDVAPAQALISGARQWLHARSIDQWQDPIPDSTIRRDAERGQLFVVRGSMGLLAMVSVHESDEETWGKQKASALYVHRLAVAQDARGRGYGQALLNWVVSRAAAREKGFVRLDCAADNPGLRDFYERLGYRFVRDVTVDAPTGDRVLSSSLYELTVSKRDRLITAT